MENEKVFIELPDELEVRQEIRTIMDRGLAHEKRLSLKRPVLALAALFLVLFFGLGFVFPTYASQIPLVGGIFERFNHFDETQRDQVSEMLIEVGLTGRAVGREEGEEIIITIEEALFDGRIIYLSYIIESEIALDGFLSISISDFLIRFDNRRATINSSRGGSGGGSSIERICDETYLYAGVTMLNINQDFEHAGDATVSVVISGTIFTETEFERLEFRAIGLERGRYEIDPGEFRFRAERPETNIFVIDETIETDEFRGVIEHVRTSALGMSIKVRGNGGLYLDFHVSDDLGNQYEKISAGGSNVRMWYDFIGTIPPEATQLIITPFENATNETFDPIIINLR